MSREENEHYADEHDVSGFSPYMMQEAMMMLPPQWQDQTLNVFKIPASAQAQAASFVISRDSNKGQHSLADYVKAQCRQYAEQMEGFALEKEEYFLSQGWEAAWVECRWILESRPLYIRQVFYGLPNQVLICTLTTSPQDIEHHETAWRQVMSSLVLQPSAAPSHAAEGH